MPFLESVFLMFSLGWNREFRISRGRSILLGLFLLSLAGCGADPERATVGLIWAPVNDSSVIGYYIHYGKQSAGQPGSCAYERELFVASSHATVTDLELGSTYYFAVSAYNGLESSCSNEVFTNT